MKRIAVSTIAVASILLGASAVSAQNADVKSIVEEVNEANKLAKSSQQAIDGVVNATDKLVTEFKGVLKTNAGLRAYNAQQRRVITKQEEEIAKIKTSIGQIDEIKRQITPLMLDMIADLEEFIAADVPFLMDERNGRIEALRENMDNPNISDPERFRLVLEAYKAEVQYGRSLYSYEGPDENGRAVNFVRLGRVGFYYQAKDGSETKAWNGSAWESLDAEFKTPVRQLIRMALKRTQQDVTVLPIAAPKGK